MLSQINKEEQTEHNRLQEYGILLEDIGRLSARRQNTNDVFISLNIVFLTAVGFLLISIHFASWWGAIFMSVIAFALFPLNFSWVNAIERYRKVLSFRHQYIQEIEKEFPAFSTGRPGGIYLRLSSDSGFYGEKVRRQFSFSAHERRLATYFLWLYVALAVAVSIVTYLVQSHVVPTFTL